MNTRLGAFAREFEAQFSTILGALRRLVGDPATETYLPTGSDLGNLLRQAESLSERISSEEAFVLIFGPLKSGKSTLMNALSKAYVSEVGSLPGYPCLVQVAHGDQPGFRVVHYNGNEESFTDLAAMRIYAQRSHGALAERLRELETEGGHFDAESVYPDAIRRIEVTMPIPSLAEASATVVDTPGLYSRMRFDYDALTRSYRNVASCAVFVVKSDNLFLEQVFTEFGELLKLFHRVFLVVNVDSKKLDLGPNGELVESLEQTDPTRIVEAFENLSMRSEMRTALDEGRLRIYPIDLLSAASRRMRQPVEAAGGPFVPSATGAGEDVVPSQSRFDGFLEELTSYLNGSGHLVDFMRDSLNRLDTLNEEVTRFCERPELVGVAARLEHVQSEMNRIQTRCSATERLSERNWEGSFEDLRQSLTARTRELAERVAESNRSEIGELVDKWVGSSASVRSLVEEDLIPLYSRAYKSLFLGVCRTLSQETEVPSGGAGGGGAIREDLVEAELSLDSIAHGVVERVKASVPVPSVPVPLTTADIPVKKGFFGWLFLRSRAGVRERLFGPEGVADVQLSEKKKAKRLPDDAGATVREVVAKKLFEFLSTCAMDLRSSLMDGYVALFTEELRKRLAHDLGEVTELRLRTDAERASLERLRDGTFELEQEAARSKAAVADLLQRYVEAPAQPEAVDEEPSEEAEHVLEPQPPSTTQAEAEGEEETPHAARSGGPTSVEGT